jgi:hypothetical protein
MLSPTSEVTIKAITASGTLCSVEIANGEIKDLASLREWHIVFSAPPSKWWNDVRFACSSIQLCTSKREAEEWHLLHGFYKGDVVGLEALWELAKVCGSAYFHFLVEKWLTFVDKRCGIMISIGMSMRGRLQRKRIGFLQILALSRVTGRLRHLYSGVEAMNLTIIQEEMRGHYDRIMQNTNKHSISQKKLLV